MMTRTRVFKWIVMGRMLVVDRAHATMGRRECVLLAYDTTISSTVHVSVSVCTCVAE